MCLQSSVLKFDHPTFWIGSTELCCSQFFFTHYVVHDNIKITFKKLGFHLFTVINSNNLTLNKFLFTTILCVISSYFVT